MLLETLAQGLLVTVQGAHVHSGTSNNCEPLIDTIATKTAQQLKTGTVIDVDSHNKQPGGAARR